MEGPGDPPKRQVPDIPNYEDFQVVGSGQFGTVYRAIECFTRVEVAIKVISLASDSDVEIARFETECDALAQLTDHPFVVHLRHAGISPSGAPYLVMPYFRSGSISDLLNEQRPSGQRITKWSHQVFAALESVHSVGIVHCDLKPSNIMISNDDRAQLVDFGIARLSQPTGESVAPLESQGTPGYSAPEVAMGGSPTAASDVYGAGRTIIAMASGINPDAALPADSEPSPQHVRAILAEGGVPIDKIGALAACVSLALSIDPTRRPEASAAVRHLGLKVAGSVFQHGCPGKQIPSGPAGQELSEENRSSLGWWRRQSEGTEQ